MAQPKTLVTDAFLVLTKDRFGHLKVDRVRQTEPLLERGERMVRIRLEVDAALWTPAPTPGTTIQVRAPHYPDPFVLASEWPQSPITDRPEEPDERRDDESLGDD